MAILKKYVPEPLIKDYRDKEGVYYEAKCDHCGRIYYPKRSTSKYCSKTCTIEEGKGNKPLNRGGTTSMDDLKKKVEASLNEIRMVKEKRERQRSEKVQKALDAAERIKKKYQRK